MISLITVFPLAHFTARIKGILRRVRQQEHLLECVWEGNSMGVVMYGFNLNISPKMSYGVLECDSVALTG